MNRSLKESRKMYSRSITIKMGSVINEVTMNARISEDKITLIMRRIVSRLLYVYVFKAKKRFRSNQNFFRNTLVSSRYPKNP
jgi:hypothetical protein